VKGASKSLHLFKKLILDNETKVDKELQETLDAITEKAKKMRPSFEMLKTTIENISNIIKFDDFFSKVLRIDGE